MSVTAVPLRPIARGALAWLWLGLAFLAVVGVGAALLGTRHIAAPPELFLARNARQPGVVVTRTGLQYQVIHQGTGPRPTPSDIVLINYVLKLTDGTLIDRGGPVPMEVAGTVPGVAEALMLMPVRSRYRVWVPPALGYGKGGGPIPPNSLLIFDIDLLAVAPRSAMVPPAGSSPAAGEPQSVAPEAQAGAPPEPQAAPPSEPQAAPSAQ